MHTRARSCSEIIKYQSRVLSLQPVSHLTTPQLEHTFSLPMDPQNLCHPLAKFVLLLASLSHVMAALYNSSIACSTLSSLLPGKVSYPREATYSASINSYYSQNEKLEPTCIGKPTSGSDVALVIRPLADIHGKHPSSSPIAAVQGGGHTPFAGAANIDNGVTIDLSGLNAVDVNPSISFPSYNSHSILTVANSSVDGPSNIIVSVGVERSGETSSRSFNI